MSQDNLYRVPSGLIPKRLKGKENRAAVIDRYDLYPAEVERGMSNRPKAVYLTNNDGMVGFYRSLLPARELNRLNHWRTTLTAEVWRPSLKDIVEGADVLVFSVPHDEDTLQRVGKWSRKALIVVDIDDNLFELPTHNDTYLFWERAKVVLDRYLKASDIITTPSQVLQNYLTMRYPDSRVFHVPNYLDRKNPTWDEPMVHTGTVRVGFSGSMSHLYDLKMLEEPLRRVMEKVPDWQFVVYGPLELYHALDLPKDRYKWFPIRPYDCWPSLLRQFTISICPLEDTPFNRCKSSLKVIESLSASALPLASRVGPFREFEEQARAWLVNDGKWSQNEEVLPMFSGPDSFAHTLETMLTHPDVFDSHYSCLSEFVSRACTSEQLGRLPNLFNGEYRRKFGRPMRGMK